MCALDLGLWGPSSTRRRPSEPPTRRRPAPMAGRHLALPRPNTSKSRALPAFLATQALNQTVGEWVARRGDLRSMRRLSICWFTAPARVGCSWRAIRLGWLRLAGSIALARASVMKFAAVL